MTLPRLLKLSRFVPSGAKPKPCVSPPREKPSVRAGLIRAGSSGSKRRRRRQRDRVGIGGEGRGGIDGETLDRCGAGEGGQKSCARTFLPPAQVTAEKFSRSLKVPPAVQFKCQNSRKRRERLRKRQRRSGGGVKTPGRRNRRSRKRSSSSGLNLPAARIFSSSTRRLEFVLFL